MPDFVASLPTLKELVILLPRLIAEMQEQGLPNNPTLFFGGHSLGGAVVNDFTGTYEYTYKDIYDQKKIKFKFILSCLRNLDGVHKTITFSNILNN